jgi:MFS family permease
MTTTEELSPRIVLMSTIGVVAVMLLAALDGTIVGTAMPSVIADLQGFEHYAAVTTTYMLAATVVVPIVGKLSDMYGRKPFLLAGVAIFVTACARGASASMTQLSFAASRASVAASHRAWRSRPSPTSIRPPGAAAPRD